MDIDGWDNFSRFTSYYLSMFIHTSTYLTDISPLPQIIAIIILALSGTMLLYIFNNDKKITFLNIISVALIGLCPYFLECISYKYDAPYMALSILVSIIPFIFYRKKCKINYIYMVMVCVGTIIMCTSYQASSGIIPLITIFLAFKYWNNQESKEAIKIIVQTVIAYLVGLLIFKFFILVPVENYVSSSLLPIKTLIPKAIENLLTYFKYVLKDFRNIWLFLIGVILICFIHINIKESKQNKVLAFLVSISLILISLLLAFGLYPILEKPLFEPRAMYGIGILIALISVNATSNKTLNVAQIISLILVYCFFTFSFTYGNALSEQKRYIDFRVQSVINSLSDLEIMKNSETKYVSITGNIGKTPSINNLPKTYKSIINRLVQQSFGGEWCWDYYYFLEYFKLPNIKIIQSTSKNQRNLEIVKDTIYFTIKTDNHQIILIELK